MPTYEYQCPKCGVFELIQKISEERLKSCPKCGAEVVRLLAAPAFHLKGSGWYKTDYASSSNSSSSSNSPSNSGSEVTTNSKESSTASSEVTKVSPESTSTNKTSEASPKNNSGVD